MNLQSIFLRVIVVAWLFLPINLIAQTPDLITNLEFWLRSDSEITVVNDRVAEWGSINNALVAQNSNPSLRPTIGASVFTEQPGVVIGGNQVGPFLNITPGNASSSYTVYCLLKTTNFNNPVQYLLGLSPGTRGFGITNSNQHLVYVDGTVQIQSSVPLSANSFYLMKVTYNAINNQMMVDLNFGDITFSGIIPAQAPIDVLKIGTRSDQNWSFNGAIAELVFFSSILSAEEQQLMNTYFLNHYAPPINLPSEIQLSSFCDTILTIPNRYVDISWSNGSTSTSSNVTDAGPLVVNAITIFGDTLTETINISYPGQTISGAEICPGNDYILDTGLNENYSIQWSTGDTSTFITVSEAGFFNVQITDTSNCTYISEFVEVTIDDFDMSVELGPEDSLCAGNSLFLINGASEAVSYNWSDGSSEPALLVFDSGEYWVEVTNSNNCIATDTLQLIILGQAPEVSYSISQNCEQLISIFNDASTTSDGSTIISTQWIINEDTLSGSQLQLEFESFGTYNLEILVTTDAGCSSELSETFEIFARPQVNFNHSIPCFGQTTLFEDDSEMIQGAISEYNWDFGNGDTSDDPFAFVDFTSLGIQQVSLTVTSTDGCDSTLVKEVFVNATPAATFNWEPTCIGTAMSFENEVDEELNPLVEHTWNFGSGLNSNTPNPSFNFSSAGNHVVTHYVHAIINGFAACFNEYEEVVFVSPPPVVSFSQTAACVGDMALFENTTTAGEGDEVISQQWFLNGEEQVETLQFEWIPTETGTVIVNLEVQTEGGCSGGVTQSVIVGNHPEPEFTFTPEIGMPPLDVQFNNLGSYGSYWLWIFGSAGDSFEQEPTFTFLDTGVYQISLIIVDEAGCFGETIQELQVMEPIFDASIEQVNCVQTQSGLVVSCAIGNFGNHVLRSADITVWLANGTQVTEHWEGSLARNTLMEFTFQSLLNFDDQINEPYICVEIGNLNSGGEDVNPSNNQICKSFSTSGFELFAVFPNPAIERATLNFYVSSRTQVQFRIFQSDGKMVYESSGEYLPGFNQIQFNTNKFSSGVYVIEAISGEEREIQRMLINNLIKQ